MLRLDKKHVWKTGAAGLQEWQRTAGAHERLNGQFCYCGAWRGELGSEPTPGLFIEHLVSIFDEVKRVLRPDGTLWCNLGDSYAGSGKGPTGHNGIGDAFKRQGFGNDERNEMRRGQGYRAIPEKNLLLIPERFAIAMQDAGWTVRSRIAWCKTSAMPESVRDRPTSAWEHIWLFSKSRTYYYDAEAVRQPTMHPQLVGKSQKVSYHDETALRGDGDRVIERSAGANLRNYWLLGPEPTREPHYAAFVTEIPRRCILAGTSERGACAACGAPWRRVVERKTGEENIKPRRVALAETGALHGYEKSSLGHNGHGSKTWTTVGGKSATLGWEQSCPCPPADPVPCVVLDPFLGSGTTALVADRLGRDAVGIELKPEYVEIARRRISTEAGMFGDVQVVV